MAESLLISGLARLGLEASDEQLARLELYLEQLDKWNKVYNLTAIRERERMISYHLLDSLTLTPHIPANARCLDVGTGAGLPGIPLAIMLPQSEWLLLDSNGKKTRFVQQAIAACGLSNVKVVQARVEDYHADSRFDLIVSRAYASIADFVATVEHLWQPETRLMIMKTQMSGDERRGLDESLFTLETQPLKVPGVREQRSLVSVKRRKS